MNNEIKSEIEVVELNETMEVGVELTDLELEAVSGGQRTTWTCGRPRQADEWVP
jgi:hypothetical protein